jgi:hypothetical protein
LTEARFCDLTRNLAEMQGLQAIVETVLWLARLGSAGNVRDAGCLLIYRIKTVSKPLLLIPLRLSASIEPRTVVLKFWYDQYNDTNSLQLWRNR